MASMALWVTSLLISAFLLWTNFLQNTDKNTLKLLQEVPRHTKLKEKSLKVP